MQPNEEQLSLISRIEDGASEGYDKWLADNGYPNDCEAAEEYIRDHVEEWLEWRLHKKMDAIRDNIVERRADDEGISDFRCTASCYFNRIYRGRFSCDLRTVTLGEGGVCSHYLSMLSGLSIFKGGNNGAQRESDNGKDQLDKGEAVF